MENSPTGVRALAGALALLAALTLTAGASAHAVVSPPIVKADASQEFTLSVPTEKEGATTTRVELTPPPGFSIGSFEPVPGWKRQVQAHGSGEEAQVQKVTWSGGRVPTDEAAVFRFGGNADSAKNYTFAVRQTYSDGSVVNWSGPESSDAPAPIVEAVSSLGGASGSTLSIVALIVAAVALIVAIVGVTAGRRSLA